jgi:hypothetical protein
MMSDAMPEEKKGVDLVGLGQAMEAIPDEAWMTLVETATNTFKKLVHPITSVTGGLGRLLEQKFKNMVDMEKVLFADALKKARQKLAADSRSVSPQQNLATLCPLIEGVSQATEELTREMWVNLLARDLSSDEIHPEFIHVLKRLSPADARLLAEVAKTSDNVQSRIRMARLLQSARDGAARSTAPLVLSHMMRGPKSFNLNETVLESLNLIRTEGRSRYLSEFGKSFLKAVGELSPPAPEPKTDESTDQHGQLTDSPRSFPDQ